MIDYDEVIALWRAVEGMGNVETREQLARYLERNPGLSRIARRDGRLVGAILCGHDGRRGYLYHLAVAADCRGQGLGKRLVSECLADLKALGIERCAAQVYLTNDLGLGFWRNLAWDERVDVHVFTRDL